MSQDEGIESATGAKDVASSMEVEAFRRLFPVQYIERYLDASVRPDGRPLGRARPTDVVLGQVPTTDGSALVKLGNTTMLAGVKLELCVPSGESPDQGRIAVDFQMPPICSPHVRPGRPAEDACSINEQLSNVLASAQLLDLRELLITSGKSAWVANLDIYCLNADGSLFDAALLACAAALTDLQIPGVAIDDDGKVQIVSPSGDQDQHMLDAEKVSDESKSRRIDKRRLTLGPVPVALTCMLHKKHILADPTAEEETYLQTTVTVAMDSSDKLISLYKPGGLIVATTSTIMDCIALTRIRLKEVNRILIEAAQVKAGD
ncbi:exosome complex component RRP43 [Marchantia polymorpha subsp. ruderalis]|uniref:Ribosomal RNA-processing protein 43 n=2 Tax=Marchantia polymorpha TaxID=3197 RepID=A0AAF6BIS4_MARPO|nr:hypothetical protein MARPO_0071s0030 [Marchantia polymorpha]BBN11908.1 hypothetical protein Mp_5g15800 [Marchantia polymorpha subsp. ruderalis]|eukprot:PTQ35412.1 hypothetical protein MARPO_0071s0030 [Marchantia polymorpha]